MLACELFKSVCTDEIKDIDITSVTYDSRKVKDGSVFVCIKGFETDGHKYAKTAVENGAAVVVAQDKIDVGVPVVYVENSRRVMAELACTFYGNPSEQFSLVGITGTNGKTTITYLIKSILETAGKRVGVIGTNQNIIGDKVLLTKSTTPTTPNALELQQLFTEMVHYGAEYVVMEVSSHALDLDRVHGCNFDVGVFTNLT
ncbi:MAG: Mur ligase family protein, partial [Clostridia bacterium]|nr:Mur ligase family protein [Clostridia bacterium]